MYLRLKGISPATIEFIRAFLGAVISFLPSLYPLPFCLFITFRFSFLHWEFKPDLIKENWKTCKWLQQRLLTISVGILRILSGQIPDSVVGWDVAQVLRSMWSSNSYTPWFWYILTRADYYRRYHNHEVTIDCIPHFLPIVNTFFYLKKKRTVKTRDKPHFILQNNFY